MKKILIILGLAFAASVTHAADTNIILRLKAETDTGFYADQYLSARTLNFDHDDYGYGVGLGYQITRHWAADLRLAHAGLDLEGHAVQEIGGRLVARMPFETLAPYTFLGGSFDLERDQWRVQPGAGVEIALNKTLRIFGEGALDADLKGNTGYLFSAGLRWRFGK